MAPAARADLVVQAAPVGLAGADAAAGDVGAAVEEAEWVVAAPTRGVSIT